MRSTRAPHVAAYYFPNYHVDDRNELWHGKGWTEWELVRRAEPRFDGHCQPRVPLWGYEDEADPEVMARKVAAAAEAGLTAFVFDWYWYEGRPFLHRPLENAFMAAASCDRLDFAVMWANHDWQNLHPWKRPGKPETLASGQVDAAGFEAATDYIIERYFNHPSYLRIGGKPFLSIYDISNLTRGLGGLKCTAEALGSLRQRVEAAGFSGIHLNIVVWERAVLPNDGEAVDFDTAVAALGFDSVTSYVWVHHYPLPRLLTPYEDLAEQAEQGWYRFAERFAVPYFPNVTVGWDSSPRTVQSDTFDPEIGYPHMNVIAGNTPEAFGDALERVALFLERSGNEDQLVTINAWNEWTEGSYLEPDTRHGMAYLEQLRRVFARDHRYVADGPPPAPGAGQENRK